MLFLSTATTLTVCMHTVRYLAEGTSSVPSVVQADREFEAKTRQVLIDIGSASH